MATDATTTTSSTDPANGVPRPCCSEKTLAYFILRLLLGMMLLLTGAEKFKSPDAPYSYSFANWHDDIDPRTGEVIKPGRWLNVAKPVYEFGGLNNPEVFQFGDFLDDTTDERMLADGTVVPGREIRGGERISNFIGWTFRWYGLTLPYLMLFAGVLILFGFLNRVGLFLGGAIWMSMAAGQMILPDNPTVLMLSMYTTMYVIALALVKYNRFAITRF